MIIRDEAPNDYPAISDLVVAAFERPAEANLLDALRRDGDIAFAGAAIAGNAIVGHVAFSRMTAPFPALGLGPLAVSAMHRRAGVASALVRWGVARAAKDNWRAIFVLGDAAFYERFGFEATLAAVFASPYAGPHFMALALNGDLPAFGGRVDYAPAFGRLDV